MYLNPLSDTPCHRDIELSNYLLLGSLSVSLMFVLSLLVVVVAVVVLVVVFVVVVVVIRKRFE